MPFFYHVANIALSRKFHSNICILHKHLKTAQKVNEQYILLYECVCMRVPIYLIGKYLFIKHIKKKSSSRLIMSSSTVWWPVSLQ